jgi:hypothetical protein
MSSINILKERIEKMSKYHQIEVLRILTNTPEVKLNENNNGTFINLSEQPIDILNKLEKYANYVDEQQKHLKSIEIEKNEIEQNFFQSK